MILEVSPIPKKMIMSGINAIGGSARKKLITGSSSSRTDRNQPMRNPSTTASPMPMLKLTSTRRKLAYMCCCRLPSRSCAAADCSTAQIDGKSLGLIKPDARHPSHTTISSANEVTNYTRRSNLCRFCRRWNSPSAVDCASAIVLS